MTQSRGQETRSRLLLAGQACFARQGYDATGVAEICRSAGVSKGAFYHHFPSKQALFAALLNRWLDQIDAGFAQVRAETPDLTQGLQRMAEMMDPVLDDASGQLGLFLEFVDQARRDPAVWEAVVAPYRRYRDTFSKMIVQNGTRGPLSQVDPDTAATLLVSLAVGTLVQSVFDPDLADWGQVIQTGVRILVQQQE